MDSRYARQYRRLHEQHWWWRARERAVLATLEQLDWSGPRRRILDIGCGDGLMFDRLAELGEVEGVEVDASVVADNNPWRGRIHICPFDAHFQPGRRYDAILMLDVLEHLPDPRAALAHALCLLTPEGTLLVTVPAFRALWTSHDELNRHFTRYTRRTLDELAAGLARVREMRYLFHWLFAAKLAVRVKEALLPAEPRSPRIPPRPINRALYGLTRLEQTVCGHWRLPFGGSLLAVMQPVIGRP